MNKQEQATVTELRDNFSELIDRVRFTKVPIVIFRHGRPRAVLAPMDSFEIKESKLKKKKVVNQ